MWQECLNLREELEMDALKLMSEGSLKETPPEFSIGDTVRVDVKIREGERERIQAYEGTVIAKKGSGVAETFTRPPCLVWCRRGARVPAAFPECRRRQGGAQR